MVDILKSAVFGKGDYVLLQSHVMVLAFHVTS